MKYLRYVVIMGLVFFSVVVSSCKPDDPEALPTEVAFEKLAGSWTLGTTGRIKVDGQDISPNFPGFALSFTDGGYTTTNAGDLFRASGTWTWLDDTAGTINLDDGKEITIVNLTETVFNFTFLFSGTGGVANGIGGNYDMTVTK